MTGQRGELWTSAREQCPSQGTGDGVGRVDRCRRWGPKSLRWAGAHVGPRIRGEGGPGAPAVHRV